MAELSDLKTIISQLTAEGKLGNSLLLKELIPFLDILIEKNKRISELENQIVKMAGILNEGMKSYADWRDH